MGKYEPKTQKNSASVEDFLNTIEDKQKREDSFALVRLMSKISGEKPAMWGTAIIGFGSYMWKYPDGREWEGGYLGFSPRKQSLTLYFSDGFDKYDDLLSKIGKHSTGKSCFYVKRLSDIDMKVLEEMLRASLKHLKSGGDVVRRSK